MRRAYLGYPAGALALTALIVGCSGPSVGAPPAVPTGYVISGATFSVPLAAAGIAGNATVADQTAPPNDVLTVLTTTSAPGGAPVFPVALTRAGAATLALSPRSFATANVPLVYVDFTFSQTTVLHGIPAFSFVTGAVVNPANGPLYIALLDPTKSPLAWQLAADGPAIVSGANANFTGTTTALTFNANQTYTFALYQVTTLSPSPTPTAIPTPNVITANPTSLSFVDAGASSIQTFLASEIGYAGTLSERDTCSGIVAVTPANVGGPSGTFTVTPVAAGACSVTISDTNSQTVAVPITVTLTGGTIQ